MPSKRYRSKEALGRLGEAVLAKWAYEVGYVLNASGDDRAGWDGVMESPPEAAADAERRLGHADTFPFRARIQVKATDKAEGRISKVLLSNWVRLVEAPDPAFLLVLEMGGKDVPQAAYLVHVDEAVVRSVLEQQRQNEVGPGTPLHKINRALRYRDAPQVSPLSGDGLLRAIDAAVDSVPGDYVVAKRTVVLTAGFERGVALGEVTLPNGAAIDLHDIANVEVGLAPSIPFDRLDVRRMRFGLADADVAWTLTAGEFVGGIPTPSDGVEVSLNVPGLGLSVRARGNLFIPITVAQIAQRTGNSSVLSGLPIRVQCGRIQLVSPADGNRLETTFDMPDSPTESVSLRDLREVAAFVAAARRASDAGLPIQIDVQTDSGPRFSTETASPMLDELGGPDVLAFANLVEALWRVCQRFDVENDAQTSVSEIVDQAEIIRMLDDAERGEVEGDMTLSVSFADATSAQAYEPSGGLVAYLCGVMVGDHRLLAVVRFGRAIATQPDNSTWQIHVPANDPGVLYRHASRRSSTAPAFETIGGQAAQRADEPVLLAQHPHLITGRADATWASSEDVADPDAES